MASEMISQRPLPEITALTAPFWSAARERRLVVQRCCHCEQHRFPPEPACVYCGSMLSTWEEVSGRAILWSWTLGYPPLLPFFAERAPWAVAIVQLEEGPRMVSNIVGAPVEEFEVGMPLLADFEDVSEDVTLLVFRRALREP